MNLFRVILITDFKMNSSLSFANMRFTEMVLAQEFSAAEKAAIAKMYEMQFQVDDTFFRIYLARRKALELLSQSREALVTAKADTLWIRRAVNTTQQAETDLEAKACKRASEALEVAISNMDKAASRATLAEYLVVAANTTFEAAVTSRDSGMHGLDEWLVDAADYTLPRLTSQKN